jgi:hypothetical protein
MEKTTHVIEGRNVIHGLGNTSRVRKEIRTCKHPGCNKKFEGSPTSLYCVDHRTRKSRAERFVPKEIPKPEDTNLVIESDTHMPVQKRMTCSLPGCGKDYTFTIYPDHKIYPMYCELHRTEFKRRHFQRMSTVGRRPDFQPPQYEKWTDYEMQFEEYALNQPHIIPFAKKPRGTVN